MEFHNPYRTILKPVLAVFVVVLASSCVSQSEARISGSNPPHVANNSEPRKANNDNANDFVSIRLVRTNWESRGTEIRINGDGHFEVSGVSVRKSEVIRSGALSKSAIAQLNSLIEDVDFFQLKGRGEDPPAQAWSVWRYELNISTRQRSKQVNFHSEDNSVPRGLHDITNLVSELTS